jgi:two-component system copper resistance phosphate regulon response regulator CusR
MNVLVIEDDLKIASLLERGLSEHGHQVSVSGNGLEAAEVIMGGGYDAALLDILLPGIDGLAVLEQVRAKRCKTAIMMLTAVDTLPKILEAFDLGADDYLVQPFLLEILLARLTAIARRGQAATLPPLLQVGDLILDRSRRSVRRAGKSIHLTRKQFDLLDLPMRRSGLVATREDLIEAAWGYQADVKDNTLDVYVHGLRAKLEPQSSQQQITIRTVHGTDYMIEAD